MHAASAIIEATPAAATALPCDHLSPLLQAACRAADIAGGAGPVPGVGSLTPGGIADGLGDAAMRGLTGFVVSGSAWLLGQVANVVTASTQVRIRTGWFMDHYETMASISASFALLLLLLSAASTFLHQDPGRLGRAAAMVAAAGLGTGAVVVVTDLLLTISDQLSAAVASGMAGDLKHSLRGAASGLNSLTSVSGGAASPLFPALLAALLVALAAVVIWIELLLREVAIYAAVLFFPLALAGLVWDASRAWARRLAEMLAALIFSKFVIVAILSLASGGLASGAEGFGGVLAGAALLLVAAFSPFMLMRVIGVLEVAAAASVLDGARQRGTRPVAHAGQTAMVALQRHRVTRAATVTVAGAAGPWAAAPYVAAGAVRPPLPFPRPGGARGDQPPMAKGA